MTAFLWVENRTVGGHGSAEIPQMDLHDRLPASTV